MGLAPNQRLTKGALFARYVGVGAALEAVLRYNHPQLVQLATGKHPVIKEWLKSFLNACNGSTEKQALLRRLRKVQPILDEE
jgi:hypothetical protein